MKKQDRFNVDINASWIFKILKCSVYVSNEDDLDINLYLFGKKFDLGDVKSNKDINNTEQVKNKNKNKNKNKEKNKNTPVDSMLVARENNTPVDNAKQEIDEVYRNSYVDNHEDGFKRIKVSDMEKEKRTDIDVVTIDDILEEVSEEDGVNDAGDGHEKAESIAEKIAGIRDNINKKIKGIKKTSKKVRRNIKKAKMYHGKLRNIKRDKELMHGVRSLAVELYKGLKPSKVEIEGVVGLEDPSDTGKLMGFASILVAKFGDSVRVRGDFTKAVFDDVRVEVVGDTRVASISLPIVRFWFKHGKRVIREFRS